MESRCKWATRKQKPRRRRGEIYQKRTDRAKIIGPYTRAHQTEKGNGARLRTICRRQQMIPMTTRKKPEIIKQDRWKHHPGDATRGNWERENWEKYMTTWTSPNGNIRRRIDYIMINAKHRNMTRTAQSNIHWHGDMNQNQQHGGTDNATPLQRIREIQKADTCRYRERLKYGIGELRLHPGKLT